MTAITLLASTAVVECVANSAEILLAHRLAWSASRWRCVEAPSPIRFLPACRYAALRSGVTVACYLLPGTVLPICCLLWSARCPRSWNPLIMWLAYGGAAGIPAGTCCNHQNPKILA